MGTGESTLPGPALHKVSHTLHAALALRLETFAFLGRVSQSAVIEAALEDFFKKATDNQLHAELQDRGYGRRRR